MPRWDVLISNDGEMRMKGNHLDNYFRYEKYDQFLQKPLLLEFYYWWKIASSNPIVDRSK